MSISKPSWRYTKNDIPLGEYGAQVEHFAPTCRGDIRYGGSIVYRLYDIGVKIAVSIEGELKLSGITQATHATAIVTDCGMTLRSVVAALGITETDLTKITPTDLGRRSCRVRVSYETICGDGVMKIQPVHPSAIIPVSAQ